MLDDGTLYVELKDGCIYNGGVFIGTWYGILKEWLEIELILLFKLFTLLLKYRITTKIKIRTNNTVLKLIFEGVLFNEFWNNFNKPKLNGRGFSSMLYKLMS